MKKLFSLLFAIIIVISVIPMGATAASENVLIETDIQLPKRFKTAAPIAASITDDIDLTGFKPYVLEGFKSCPDKLNISQFKIPYTQNNVTTIRNTIWYDMPEMFHIEGIGFSYNTITKNLTYIIVSYRSEFDTNAEYEPKLNEMKSTAEVLLNGIKGNDSLGDVEKALILHDRLCIWNEYDYNYAEDSYTAYGALVNKTSVCQGYAMAYMYLLDSVGIENSYCTSDTMNHGWNIVYIDGVPYHVDVTHDDNIDLVGKLSHENFLVSTDTYKSTAEIHNVDDFDSSPTDTRYENYCWQNSITEFQLVENKIYYIDNVNSAIKEYNGNNPIYILNASYIWPYYLNGFPKNMASLDSCGNELLFSFGNGVYSYNLLTEQTKKIFTPNAVTNYVQVYGFTYEYERLVCELLEIDTATNNIGVIIEQEHYAIELSNVEIYTTPAKTSYLIGDKLDTSGLVLKLTYSDGAVEYTSSDFTISGFDSSTIGTKTVNVTYEGKTALFEVEVICTHSNCIFLSRTEATYTESGETVYQCTECKNTKSEVIFALCDFNRDGVLDQADYDSFESQTADLELFDFKGNGQIDDFDKLVVRHLSNSTQLKKIADINGDETSDLKDLVRAKKIFTGYTPDGDFNRNFDTDSDANDLVFIQDFVIYYLFY